MLFQGLQKHDRVCLINSHVFVASGSWQRLSRIQTDVAMYYMLSDPDYALCCQFAGVQQLPRFCDSVSCTWHEH